ncbi:MAG TPA: GNAT family N-acetyltransferase [Candidatus Limosilactobacillus merdigallinarum]|uniref:GNAT family N-acetyltransferase n=1 Tax=Candidatus Limosilactobacillus merdigallinarum TaxID=2838652 RepID=A0A9D1VJ41_9LACO|nr:GNAT family N-acetyltransferase [Candidatus Limosilactobacillus merdigallinarum]
MEYRLAKLSDIPELCSFYQEVCGHQNEDKYSPDWQWGIHPSEAMLTDAINDPQEMLLIAVDGARIAAAGVLYTGDDDIYDQGHWLQTYPQDTVRVLHLFATRPQYRGHGLSKQFLQYILQQAKANGARVVHLDIVASNMPAQRSYERAGFKVSQSLNLNYADIGPTPAKLMEASLDNLEN